MQPERATINVVVSKGGAKNLTLRIPLPNVNTPISIRLFDGDGNVLANGENINPSADGYWRPVITGAEDRTMEVLVYIRPSSEEKGKLWQTYKVNFEDGTQEVVRDRSDHSDFNY